MSTTSPFPADSQLARKARALVRYGPGCAIEVAIFWVMLEAFQQLNYGGRVINGIQSGMFLVLSVAFVVLAMGAAEARFGLYRRIWKVAGIHDAIATAFPVAEASILIALPNWALPQDFRAFRLAAPLRAAPAPWLANGP